MLFPRYPVVHVTLWIVLIASLVFVGSGVARACYQMYLHLKYPLDHVAEIMACQEEFGLDPAYVAAVIYEESRFNPDAQSHQNAIGLMQIVPETGAYIAEKLNDPGFVVTKLREIPTNIRYGCYYLSYLEERYGERDLVLAAYNAGPGTVDQWLAEEDYRVQFVETENFVMRVNASEQMYRMLYGYDLGG